MNLIYCVCINRNIYKFNTMDFHTCQCVNINTITVKIIKVSYVVKSNIF